MTTKAVGKRGSWFASVDGELLPCVHRYWMQGLKYDDPHVVVGDRQWDEFIAAIQAARRVVMTNDDPLNGGTGFSRTGYIAEFEVDDISVDGSHLRFRIVKRLRDLK